MSENAGPETVEIGDLVEAQYCGSPDDVRQGIVLKINYDSSVVVGLMDLQSLCLKPKKITAATFNSRQRHWLLQRQKELKGVGNGGSGSTIKDDEEITWGLGRD